jgi:NADPH2:quinone reductase
VRALRVKQEDGPDAIELADVPEPESDFVIAVRAAGVSFPDLLMTRGEYQMRQQLPFTLGWEAAGDVVRAPSGGPFSEGDRVVTMSLGAHAEQVAAIPAATFPLPAGLSYEEGAALPLNYLTALAAVERRGRLCEGERVLIHGAAGGVGTATIQVAKALGANVIAVVSSDAKAEVARTAGADEVLIGEDFRSTLSEPVNLIIDPVGGTERFKESLRALVPEGRLVVVGFTSGEIPEIKVNRLLLRNVDVCGC